MTLTLPKVHSVRLGSRWSETCGAKESLYGANCGKQATLLAVLRYCTNWRLGVLDEITPEFVEHIKLVECCWPDETHEEEIAIVCDIHGATLRTWPNLARISSLDRPMET